MMAEVLGTRKAENQSLRSSACELLSGETIMVPCNEFPPSESVHLSEAFRLRLGIGNHILAGRSQLIYSPAIEVIRATLSDEGGCGQTSTYRHTTGGRWDLSGSEIVHGLPSCREPIYPKCMTTVHPPDGEGAFLPAVSLMNGNLLALPPHVRMGEVGKECTHFDLRMQKPYHQNIKYYTQQDFVRYYDGTHMAVIWAHGDTNGQVALLALCQMAGFRAYVQGARQCLACAVVEANMVGAHVVIDGSINPLDMNCLIQRRRGRERPGEPKMPYGQCFLPNLSKEKIIVESISQQGVDAWIGILMAVDKQLVTQKPKSSHLPESNEVGLEFSAYVPNQGAATGTISANSNISRAEFWDGDLAWLTEEGKGDLRFKVGYEPEEFWYTPTKPEQMEAIWPSVANRPRGGMDGHTLTGKDRKTNVSCTAAQLSQDLSTDCPFAMVAIRTALLARAASRVIGKRCAMYPANFYAVAPNDESKLYGMALTPAAESTLVPMPTWPQYATPFMTLALNLPRAAAEGAGFEDSMSADSGENPLIPRIAQALTGMLSVVARMVPHKSMQYEMAIATMVVGIQLIGHYVQQGWCLAETLLLGVLVAMNRRPSGLGLLIGSKGVPSAVVKLAKAQSRWWRQGEVPRPEYQVAVIAYRLFRGPILIANATWTVLCYVKKGMHVILAKRRNLDSTPTNPDGRGNLQASGESNLSTIQATDRKAWRSLKQWCGSQACIQGLDRA